MPPGKREKLTAEEISLVKAWIDGGALPPKEEAIKELTVPKIVPRVAPKDGILALAYAKGPKLLASANHGTAELQNAENRGRVRAVEGHRGAVNPLAFSADGAHLF